LDANQISSGSERVHDSIALPAIVMSAGRL
jgi:hypothetical protein